MLILLYLFNPVVTSLRAAQQASELDKIQKLTMTLVDGTLIAALPKLMQASVLKSQTGSGMVKWRLHHLLRAMGY